MLLHYLRENKINWNFFHDEALFLVEEIVQDVYQETKSANARQFLLTDQAEYEKKGR